VVFMTVVYARTRRSSLMRRAPAETLAIMARSASAGERSHELKLAYLRCGRSSTVRAIRTVGLGPALQAQTDARQLQYLATVYDSTS